MLLKISQSAAWTLNPPSHAHLGRFFVQRFVEHFGENHQCLQSLIFYCTDFSSRPSFQNWGIFHMFMQLHFFIWSKRAGEASMILSSDGIQSQVKSPPAATSVYRFSLFQVLTMLNFLLNFIRFSSVFRKIPHCSVWGGACATSAVHEQVHFASFPPKTTHCNIVFFSLWGWEKARLNCDYM